MLGFLFTNRSFSGSAYRTFCSLFVYRCPRDRPGRAAGAPDIEPAAIGAPASNPHQPSHVAEGARVSLDRHATYVVAAFIAGAAR
jgi:hypothetical protein